MRPGLDGDSQGVEGGCLDFDARGGVPVVEFVAVPVEDGGDGGPVAVLGFAHEDGTDLGEESMGAVEEVDLGAFDVDLDKAGRRGLVEKPVVGDAEDLVGLAGASGLRVFGDGGEMVGVAVAFCDVEGFDADGAGDCDGQDVDGSGSEALGCGAAVEESSEPEVGFDGDDTAARACFLGGGGGEEANVGADVPDGVAGVDELTGEIEEIGAEAGGPVSETGIGRDMDWR